MSANLLMTPLTRTSLQMALLMEKPLYLETLAKLLSVALLPLPLVLRQHLICPPPSYHPHAAQEDTRPQKWPLFLIRRRTSLLPSHHRVR